MTMPQGFTLRNGRLRIAGRLVARDVLHIKRIRDRLKNRTLIAALISWESLETRARNRNRNIVAFTLSGGRVWTVAEASGGPRRERYFTGLGGSALYPTATTSSGWVYDINASDGSLWYLKWVK